MSSDSYLHLSMATTLQTFLPPKQRWFEETEEAKVWVSVFRVFRVPYSVLQTTADFLDLGNLRIVFTNVNLPYPEFSFGWFGEPDGGARPKHDLIGWQASDSGMLLMVMTPYKSDHQYTDPETAARHRISSARAILVAIVGTNAAFQSICDFSADYQKPNQMKISRTSPAMENPMVHPAPEIYEHEKRLLVYRILEQIDLLDQNTESRVHLALRWYNRAITEERTYSFADADADSLLNYWIALETLVAVGQHKIAGSLITALSEIHAIDKQKVGQIFPISQIYKRRSEIVHRGHLARSTSLELENFLSDLFMDVLVLRTIKIDSPSFTRKYLDGRAYNYL